MRLSKKMNSVSLFMRMKMKHHYIPVVEKGDPRCGITEFSMKKHMDIIAKLQKEAKEHDGTASTLLEESANKEDFNFKEEVELTDRYHSILNTPYDEKKLRKLLPSK